MGFDGKTLIHPSQVDLANEMWAPSAAEVEYAERAIAAFDEGLADGRGVVTVDGRMIENLHVANARRVLAVVAAISALGWTTRSAREDGSRNEQSGAIGDQGSVIAARISSNASSA